MCSDTECLDMLIVLHHICLFLMPYDNGDMSLGDSEAVTVHIDV